MITDEADNNNIQQINYDSNCKLFIIKYLNWYL